MTERWLNLKDGVPPPSLFNTTGGNGTALVVDTSQEYLYYKKPAGLVTPILGAGNVVAAHGGMRITTPRALANFGLTLIPIVGYDVITYSPLYILTDLVNGTLEITRPSSYQINFDINITFDELNQGRRILLSLVRLPDNVVVSSIELFVGRNTEGLAEFLVWGVTANLAALGKQYQLQIGGGDAFTNVVLRSSRYEVIGVGA